MIEFNKVHVKMYGKLNRWGDCILGSNAKELIVDTFLSLLNENDYDKITVTDLVESCKISRQTFYYHFNSIEEMIKWAFEEESKKALEKAKGCANWVEASYFLVPMLERFNPLFFSAKKSQSLLTIQRQLTVSIYYFTAQYYRSRPNFDQNVTEKQKFMVKYLSTAIVGLIFMEVEYDEEFSYKKIFDQIANLFHSGKN